MTDFERLCREIEELPAYEHRPTADEQAFVDHVCRAIARAMGVPRRLLERDVYREGTGANSPEGREIPPLRTRGQP